MYIINTLHPNIFLIYPYPNQTSHLQLIPYYTIPFPTPTQTPAQPNSTPPDATHPRPAQPSLPDYTLSLVEMTGLNSLNLLIEREKQQVSTFPVCINFHPILDYPILPPTLPTLPYYLPYHTQPYPTQPYPTIPYLLPYPIISYPILSYPALPLPPHPTLPLKPYILYLTPTLPYPCALIIYTTQPFPTYSTLPYYLPYPISYPNLPYPFTLPYYPTLPYPAKG